MIDVYFCRSGNRYTGFYVTGHANYAERGKDIVCAAVSALTIALENSLVELSDVPIMRKRYIDKEYEKIFIPTPSDKTDLLFEQYRIGIQGIVEAYPKNVTLHLET